MRKSYSILLILSLFILVCSIASAISISTIGLEKDIDGLAFDHSFSCEIESFSSLLREMFRDNQVLACSSYEYHLIREPKPYDQYIVLLIDLGSESVAAEKVIEYCGLSQYASNLGFITFEGKRICRATDENGRAYIFSIKNIWVGVLSDRNKNEEGSVIELDVQKLASYLIAKESDLETQKVDTNPSKTAEVEHSVSVKAPNVITKRITPGTINIQDGEIVFEISNEDPNHKMEGYLACDIPSDVIVTSSMGAATGAEAQYISQKFVIDPAPGRESMSLRLSSQKEGSKYVRCTVNYVLFKEDSGYLKSNGQYSQDKAYQQLTVNRDISFVEAEDNSPGFWSQYKHFIIGGGFIFLVSIGFLIYKIGDLSGRVENNKVKIG